MILICTTVFIVVSRENIQYTLTGCHACHKQCCQHDVNIGELNECCELATVDGHAPWKVFEFTSREAFQCHKYGGSFCTLLVAQLSETDECSLFC